MMRDSLRRFLHHSGLIGPVRRVQSLLPAGRREEAALRAAHTAFLGDAAARIRDEVAPLPTGHKALMVGYSNAKLASFQAPLIFALRAAGFHTTVLLGTAQGAAAAFYRALGANTVVASEELALPPDRETVRHLCRAAGDPATLLALEHRGRPIGKFVASTLMRRHRIGSVDPRAPGMQEAMATQIAASVEAVEIAEAAIAQTEPELVCFYDRGYTPDGELFEAALASGARAITFNAAHKSGLIMSKRYDPHNKDQHFGAPSRETWAALCAMPWGDGHWQRLRREVEGAYHAGTWYDEVGTQFNKRVPSAAELIRDLGLDPGRKTAVVFPHLFWDATFFWGEDLFDDYRDWFCHVLRAAAANDRLNWIVKVHPANRVKNARDGYEGEASELVAIREVLGKLPAHIKVLPPDSPVSTLSLYDIMDVCLTVRGTVGLEAAMYGIPVLTAGSGRYDGYGFTVDSASREAYLDRLKSLETVTPPDAAAIEAARRYCYGLFVQRPLALRTLRFHYAKDAAATLNVALDLPATGRIVDSPDIARLVNWLASDREDLLAEDVPESAINATPATVEYDAERLAR